MKSDKIMFAMAMEKGLRKDLEELRYKEMMPSLSSMVAKILRMYVEGPRGLGSREKVTMESRGVHGL